MRRVPRAGEGGPPAHATSACCCSRRHAARLGLRLSTPRPFQQLQVKPRTAVPPHSMPAPVPLAHPLQGVWARHALVPSLCALPGMKEQLEAGCQVGGTGWLVCGRHTEPGTQPVAHATTRAP